MFKKSEAPAGTVSRHHGLGQGAWIVFTGRSCSLRWVELLGSGVLSGL